VNDTEDVARRIRMVLIRSLSLNLNEADLRYTDKLDKVAGLDSLAVLEFLTALEKEFHITIDPERMNLETLRDLPTLAGYIMARLPADNFSGERTERM
jgi:acyl carrier protein